MARDRKPKIPWTMRIALIAAIILILLFWILSAGTPMRVVSDRADNAAFLQALEAAAQSYITDNGPFPKNLDNHTFWSDLSGADSGKVYMSFTTNQMNDKGELVDRWGTPLRVWYVSDREIGIASAGNDKTFGTSDDITTQ